MPVRRRVYSCLVVLAMLAAFCVAGCGNKGPLVRPPPDSAAAAPAG